MKMASILSANNQRQTRGHAGSALRASTPAVVDDKAQDWPARCRAGFAGESGLSLVRYFHRLRSLTLYSATGRRLFPFSSRSSRRNLRVRALVAAPRHFILVPGPDCRPCRRNTLTHEQAVNPMAHVSHHQVPSLISRSQSNQHGRSARAWRYQFQVMRCPE